MLVPHIETERLLMRPFVIEDAEALFSYASAPEFSKFVAYDSPETLAEVKAFLKNELMLETEAQISWAVCLRGLPNAIGSQQITRNNSTSITVHYDIDRNLYGRGYTTEALQGVLRWSLNHLPEVKNFYGDTMALNIASRRVLEKCGFIYYKTEKEHWQKFIEPVEIVYYKAQSKDLKRTLFEEI